MLRWPYPGVVIGAVAIALALGAAQARAEIVKSFEFDVDGVLPSADPEIEYFNDGFAVTEAEVFSVSGGVLKQRSLAFDGGYGYSFPDASLTGGGIDATQSFSMEARLKVLAIEGTDGAFFEVFDGANGYGPLFMATGEARFFVASGVETVVLPDITQFHIYRVESEANSAAFNFYVDGELVFSGIAQSITVLNGFDWGDGLSSPGNGADADWDFVKFSQPAGPITLPEIPKCDIELDQATYTAGDTVTAASRRLTNPGADATAVEIKTWLDRPELPPVSILSAGADGSVVLPAGFDQDFGPMALASVTVDTPLGPHALNCRLLDPVTGETLSVDINQFEIE